MLDSFIEDEMNVDVATVHIGGHGDYIKIKSATDKKFERQRELVLKRHKQTIKRDKMKGGLIQKEIGPLVAKHLLVDWQMSSTVEVATKLFPDIQTENSDRKGVVFIPFTVENAIQVITHPRNKEFFLFCIEQAGETANFVAEDQEDDRKNSLNSLPTS